MATTYSQKKYYPVKNIKLVIIVILISCTNDRIEKKNIASYIIEKKQNDENSDNIINKKIIPEEYKENEDKLKISDSHYNSIIKSLDKLNTIKEVKKNIKSTNTLILKILNFKKGGDPPSIADFQKDGIHLIKENKISHINDLLLSTPFIEIDSIEKITLWLSKHITKHHVILTFNLASNTTWKDLITQGKSENIIFYNLEINNANSTITLSSLHENMPLLQLFDLPLTADWRERSSFFMEALKKVADYIHGHHPYSEYHWYSLMKEFPDGHFVQGQLNASHLLKTLNYWTREIRIKNMSTINIGFYGNKSGFIDIDNFCHFSDFVISTDVELIDINHLLTGSSTNFLERIHILSTQNKTNINLNKQLLEIYKTRIKEVKDYLDRNDIFQSIYLYNCKNFIHFKRQFIDKIKPFKVQTERDNLAPFTAETDIYSYISQNSITLKEKDIDELLLLYNNIFESKIKSNLDTLIKKNGMAMPDISIITID